MLMARSLPCKDREIPLQWLGQQFAVSPEFMQRFRPPAAFANFVAQRIIKSHANSPCGIPCNDCEIVDILSDDRASAHNRTQANALAAGQNQAAMSNPDIMLDHERTILQTVDFDELEQRIIERGMRGQIIDGMVSAKNVNIAAKRAIPANRDIGA